MDIYSVLNTQSVASSNQAQVNTQTTEEIAAADAEEQKIKFLQLLLTQLENQNPLDPMDTDEYTAQLTRYSILEQGIETNEKLSVANEYLRSNVNNTVLSYIGERIETSTNVAPVQNGEASWSYTVNGDADEVILTFLDEDGNIVAEEDGNAGYGVHTHMLDATALGLDEGAAIEMVVAARDSNDGALDVETTAYAVVDGVWTDDQDTYFTAGSVSFRADDVLKVNEIIETETTL